MGNNIEVKYLTQLNDLKFGNKNEIFSKIRGSKMYLIMWLLKGKRE